MKKVRIAVMLLVILFPLPSLNGCTLISGDKQAYIYERPTIGLTVKDEITTDIEIGKQSSLSLAAGYGVIRITPYDGDKLQVIEKRKFTGPSSKRVLKAILDENKLNIEKESMEVNLYYPPEEKQKPLFSLIIDIELRVPDTVKTLEITLKGGGIQAEGLKGMDSLDLKVDKGNIDVDYCEGNRITAAISNGNLDVDSSSGIGSYKCGRGNIKLQKTKGNIDLKSVAGNTLIEEVEGRLECDVSAGDLTVGKSRISKDSTLYASCGDIKVDFNNLDLEGKFTVKASKGTIKLKLPETTGWSLLARSTKGKISKNLELEEGVLKTAPSGEVYGDVHGGGPLIDAYVDMGNIVLN